jgi:hypothetical protein
MVTVTAETPLAHLDCGVCHRRVRIGDSVLVTYRMGEPRVMHAHVCTSPRAAGSGSAREASLAGHQR